MRLDALSDSELSAAIKKREASGQTGVTCTELDALNREQTARMTEAELVAAVRNRGSDSKVGKELERRGVVVSAELLEWYDKRRPIPDDDNSMEAGEDY